MFFFFIFLACFFGIYIPKELSTFTLLYGQSMAMLILPSFKYVPEHEAGQNSILPQKQHTHKKNTFIRHRTIILGAA
jgi:hypothetical protein